MKNNTIAFLLIASAALAHLVPAACIILLAISQDWLTTALAVFLLCSSSSALWFFHHCNKLPAWTLYDLDNLPK
jgi:hypothetical protein